MEKRGKGKLYNGKKIGGMEEYGRGRLRVLVSFYYFVIEVERFRGSVRYYMEGVMGSRGFRSYVE